ncbi:MAG: transpeptidase family protein [Bacteroidales bacterium]|nr:transpeptidase family protein [Bacteroidales bacterium]
MANEMEKAHKMITMALVAMVIVCLAIFIKAFHLKVFSGDTYKSELDRFNSKKVRIDAVRGSILARDGRKLACSVPMYKVCIDPAIDVKDSIFNSMLGKLSRQLAEFYGDKSAREYRERIEKARTAKKRYLVLNPRLINYEELQRLMSFDFFQSKYTKACLQPEQIDIRKLPFGLLAARTIGRLRENKRLGGEIGIENSYDKILKGKDGRGTRRMRAGRWNIDEDEPAENGRDVMTTIDIDIQDVAEYSLLNQLKAHEADHGVAILMEVKTGAIRAIVNLSRQEDGSYAETYNYAVGELAEPGSTFKLATVMACLEDGGVTAEDTIDTYNGEYKIYDRVMRDSKVGGHGNVTVKQAFEVSSNIAFSRLAMKCFGGDKQRFVERLHDLGLCDSLGIEIKGEGRSYIKDVNDPTWSGTTLPWMSIGYEVRITPLQLLTFYNAVANNGTMMKPMIVEGQMEDGKRVVTNKPKVMRTSIASRRTINTVKEMLKGVVEQGTARNISNTPYKIAGKTGTAQIAQAGKGYSNDGQKRYLASFAGYFPADAPLYSCVVMVYGPSRQVYYGNVLAGNVVKAIADRVYAAEFRRGTTKIQPERPSTGRMPYSKGGRLTELMKAMAHLHIPHSIPGTSSEWASTEAGEKSVSITSRHFVANKVPDTRGLGAADAVALVEGMGMRVMMSGTGRVVSQEPAAGTTYSRSTTVKLTLGD